jgi:type II secretory pathway predicted ATPase ExeA
MYQLPPDNKKDMKFFLNKSLFMIGKRRDLDSYKAILTKVYKNQESVSILVRGVFGSGKSLFCRKLLYEFFDQNKELKAKLMYQKV